MPGRGRGTSRGAAVASQAVASQAVACLDGEDKTTSQKGMQVLSLEEEAKRKSGSTRGGVDSTEQSVSLLPPAYGNSKQGK